MITIFKYSNSLSEGKKNGGKQISWLPISLDGIDQSKGVSSTRISFRGVNSCPGFPQSWENFPWQSSNFPWPKYHFCWTEPLLKNLISICLPLVQACRKWLTELWNHSIVQNQRNCLAFHSFYCFSKNS